MKTCLLITTFNRGHVLEHSLERLTHLTIPNEVLIVDDGSDRNADATEWICKGFQGRLPIRYLYNNNPQHSICSFARNIGVKNTDCDIIITSEPELLFVSDVIWQMLRVHANHPDYVITAGTIYHMQEKATVSDAITTNPKGFLNQKVVEDYQIEPRPYDPEGFVKTVNLTASFCALYEKSWITDIGGWDENFPGNYGWDDTDLLTRLRISGHNQIIDKQIECIHQWHPHQPPHIQGVQADLNDKYFTAKHMQDNTSPYLIANKDHEWGTIKTEEAV